MNWLERLVDRSAPPAASRASLTPPRPSVPDPDDPEAAQDDVVPTTPAVEAAPSTTPASPRRAPPAPERVAVDAVREPPRSPAGRKEPAAAKRAATTEPARDGPQSADVEATSDTSRIRAPAPSSAPAPPIAHVRHSELETPGDRGEGMIAPPRSTPSHEPVRDAEAISSGPAPTATREELRPPRQTSIPQRAPASLSIGRVIVEIVAPPTTPAVAPVPAARTDAPRPATPPLRSARVSSLRFGLGMT